MSDMTCSNCERTVGVTVLRTLPPEKKGEPPMEIRFMAGMCSTGRCWWCEFPSVGRFS